MKLFVLTGYDKDQRESALVMTGTDNNGITQFAKKSNAVASSTRTDAPVITEAELTDGGISVVTSGFDGMSMAAAAYTGDVLTGASAAVSSAADGEAVAMALNTSDCDTIKIYIFKGTALVASKTIYKQ